MIIHKTTNHHTALCGTKHPHNLSDFDSRVTCLKCLKILKPEQTLPKELMTTSRKQKPIDSYLY
jgi:hypothetical protein